MRTSSTMAATLVGLLTAAALVACTAAARPPAAAPTAAVASGSAAAPCATPTAQPGAEVVASTAAIPTGSLPKVRFLPVAGAAVTLPLEVPPACEYGIGLSGRKTLAERGMLFYFPETSDVPFWMLDTHIDLDIAFVDKGLTVLMVETMKADTRDYHRPGTPYIAAIEAPAGWYTAHGIKPGATVVFDFDLKAATGR